MLTGVLVLACNDSSEYLEPGPRPQVVGVTGPRNGAVACDPDTVGGSCLIPIAVTFRLPAEHFVWKVKVRFQGDGGDEGVDRGYLIPPKSGAGLDRDVTVNVEAGIPPTVLRTGATFTYTVRLVTGVGEESDPSTLTVSNQ